MLRVGGVPEHFNLPWRLAHQAGFFRAHDLEVDWVEQPGGTGEMLSRLADGSLDVAALLTEGIVRAIANGLEARIAALYISSPLRWGIHVSGASSRHREDDLAGARFAITRRGSGSHLMAFVLAERLGIDIDERHLVEVGSLKGARAALKSGDADVLLWDRFMLSRLVRDGELRRVGVQPTPWPSFVLAARTPVLRSRPAKVTALARAIAELARTLREDPRAPTWAVDQYGLQPHETSDWLRTTQWDAGALSAGDVREVQRKLKRIGLLSRVRPASAFLS
jgi:ABC-type nitrate/sulfonate/bicarbonate transport system substrate-binding protein